MSLAVTTKKTGNTKWPLTGGVPSELSTPKIHVIERLYISGYQDGSVRICDATFPKLSSISILRGEVHIPKCKFVSISFCYGMRFVSIIL